MANALFNGGREGFLSGALDWGSDNVKVALGRGYTYSAAHKFRSDLTGFTAVATSGNLTGKTVTDGAADAEDVVLTAVSAGAACTSLIIYKDNGSAATDRLIAYIDSGTGLPVTPNGTDITIVWSDGANKIFRL